jgi:hypothetical protein
MSGDEGYDSDPPVATAASGHAVKTESEEPTSNGHGPTVQQHETPPPSKDLFWAKHILEFFGRFLELYGTPTRDLKLLSGCTGLFAEGAALKALMDRKLISTS